MIALRREATEVIHEDYMDGIMEVNAKKKANLMYYAWREKCAVFLRKDNLMLCSNLFTPSPQNKPREDYQCSFLTLDL